MARHGYTQWLRTGGAVVLLSGFGLSLNASPVHADEGSVVKRLTKHAKLSDGEAKRIAGAVDARMKRGADMTNNNDPLRMAVSTALYHVPVPADAMAAAKVRLRLYAGLTEWALESLFAPKPGAIVNCTAQFSLSKHDCEALMAAAGRTSLADAARQGAGAPAGTPVYAAQPASATGLPRPAYGAPRPVYGAQPAASNGQHFGQNNGGYVAPATAPAYAAQPAYAARPAAPAWHPTSAVAGAPPATPAPAAPPVGQRAAGRSHGVAAVTAAPANVPAPAANASVIAARKAEYERQRQAYLDRKKQEMDARKSKIVATAGGNTNVERGPASADEAAKAVRPVPPAVSAPSSASSPRAASAVAPAAAAAPDSPAEAAPVEAAPAGQGLGSDFLDGLVADPLGKTK